MSPYALRILLWYHSRCEDHPDMDRKPPIWQETIDGFINDGLLEGAQSGRAEPGRQMVYAPTPRLHAYVDALCSVPLPRPTWVVDWPKPTDEYVATFRRKLLEEINAALAEVATERGLKI